HPADHFIADLLLVLPLVHLEVPSEEINDGTVRGRLVVGEGAGLHDPPAGHSLGAGGLGEEARLSHSPPPPPPPPTPPPTRPRPPRRPPARRCPRAAVGRAASSGASSSSRPTKLVRPRAAAPSMGQRAMPVPVTKYTPTTACRPRIERGPSGTAST